ncbi:alpha/beta fold hydrolase [Actinomadura madurae]|uniref:alpha/beta fold hydrolase n=1 Tax=Actinomadura madurae TaxID=1993 RepID=UPI002025BA24|nr:alpha/beta hydrolase [Actinomadura madurae]MCP9955554.1 alpha/beta hydrolase [Actinomadura madurae]MCP9984801.1 alpha/beta hydrolase [Actinomadura madurae]MCQ0003645.1 alpha/beta hydrolase [Actinomadura madurae]URN03156.1 alpha/beta hydrolase [Actinomadura madurae]
MNQSTSIGRRRVLLGGAGLAAASALMTPKPAAAAPRDDDLRPVPIPPQVPATEGRVSFGAGELWFWDTGGSGEPVVLLHAYTGSGRSWRYQQPVLARAGYRVIGYSRRGHRNSDPGPSEDTGTYADDLHALVEHLGLRTMHLVGTAAGSIAAADYLLSYPERVASAALTCSLVAIGDPDYAADSAALRPPQWNELPKDFQELGGSYRATNPDGVAIWLDEAALAPPAAARQRTKATVTSAAIASSGVPVLLATGDADLYTPPAMLRRLGEGLPRAEQVVFPESGHNAYWERPLLFNRTILAFLRRNRIRHRGPRR